MTYSYLFCSPKNTFNFFRVSEWLLFKANSAIFQSYHDENNFFLIRWPIILGGRRGRDRNVLLLVLLLDNKSIIYRVDTCKMLLT
jgi:hypothetical protein